MIFNKISYLDSFFYPHNSETKHDLKTQTEFESYNIMLLTQPKLIQHKYVSILF